jgi:hypothetical protein
MKTTNNTTYEISLTFDSIERLAAFDILLDVIGFGTFHTDFPTAKDEQGNEHKWISASSNAGLSKDYLCETLSKSMTLHDLVAIRKLIHEKFSK